MTPPKKPKLTPPTIETDRLLLRPFVPADADALRRVLDHQSVARATDDVAIPYTVAHAAEFIEENAAAIQRSERLVFAALRRDSGELIAEVGLWEIDWRHRRADLGIALHPDHWGRGYGTEALATVVQVGFEGLNLRRIDGGCFPWNTASERLMLRCGLQPEGRRREYVLQFGVWEDEALFGILRSEWPERGRRVIRTSDPPLASIAEENAE